MQQAYGIIVGNIDEHVTALISSDDKWEEIQSVQDPIRLLRILRKACRQEKGINYSIAVFHSSLMDLVTCKQGNRNTVEYIQDIKLKYDVLTSQFGEDFIPTTLKESVMSMHENQTWLSVRYADCDKEERKMIDRST